MTTIEAFRPSQIKTQGGYEPFDIKFYGLRLGDSKTGLNEAKTSLHNKKINSFYISVNNKNTSLLSMLHDVNIKKLRILLGDNSYNKKKRMKRVNRHVYVRDFSRAFRKASNISLELETAVIDCTFLSQLSADVMANPKKFNSVLFEYTDLARHLDSIRILDGFNSLSVTFKLDMTDFLGLNALEKVTLCNLHLNISLQVKNIITLMKIRLNGFCKNIFISALKLYKISEILPLVLIHSNDDFIIDLKKPPVFDFKRQHFNVLFSSGMLTRNYYGKNSTKGNYFHRRYERDNIIFLAQLNKIKYNAFG